MTGRSPSILHRIVWLHVLALAGITIAITAAAYLLLNATVNDFEERILRDHAASVSPHLILQNGQWSLHLPSDLQAVYSRGYGGYALAVLGDDGHVIYSSLANESPFINAEPRKAQPTFFHQNRGASVYYGMILPVERAGRFAWIQVGQDLENPDVIIDDVVALFLGRIAWLVIPIFVVLLFVDVLLMRRLLSSIIAASHVATQIGPDRPLLRLPTGELPREILPLAKAVNEALDRLEKGLQAQREFTADASHELRTPLTILRTHVETMLDARAAAALKLDIDALGRVLEQLLELADLEGLATNQSERVNLEELGAEVVSLMAPIALAENKAIELICGTKPIWVFGNAEMLSRALRNLVENAIRHSDANQLIEIEIVLPATIRVKDRGPGIIPSERELVFQRFWRKNRRERGHCGLGLAIVTKIIQLHRGAVRVIDRRGGGAQFEIVLPAM